MRHMFKFPDIGEGITEGQIVEWRVKRGQQVQTGDPLVEMETDKVVTDIPSPRDGTVVALYGSEGDTINVGDPLVELEIEGVSSEEAQQIAQEKPAPPSQEPVDEGDGGVVGTIEVAGEGAYLPASDEGVDRSEETQSGRRRGKALATPVARAVARNLNIDINRIRGTGPAGRVTKDDVHRFAERQADGETAAPSRSGRGGRAAATAGGTDAPRGVGGQPGTGPRPADEETEELEYRQLSGIRKTIARHMVESKHNAAHMSVTEEAEISELVELRARHKQRFADRGVRLTYLPFILKAIAAALKRHPSLNAEMDLEHNRRPRSELAAAIDDLSTRARERKLSMDELKGGTFSVTSYGSIGGLFAVPVINYPEAAILGIGRIHKRPIVIEGPGGDEIGIGTIMPLSLSVDHRIVDGGEATRFLNDIVEFLESPASMFID
ncbi:MAG: dihydrolipoamide acetyltransferase family protein [Spirochaetota bacterium]